MARNTHAQEAATGTSDSYTEAETGDWQSVVANRPQLGEVDKPSVGNNSSASDRNQSPTTSNETEDPQEGAPGAGNLSSPEKTGVSVADSTDGNTRQTGKASARRPAPRGKATGTQKSDEFDF